MYASPWKVRRTKSASRPGQRSRISSEQLPHIFEKFFQAKIRRTQRPRAPDSGWPSRGRSSRHTAEPSGLKAHLAWARFLLLPCPSARRSLVARRSAALPSSRKSLDPRFSHHRHDRARPARNRWLLLKTEAARGAGSSSRVRRSPDEGGGAGSRRGPFRCRPAPLGLRSEVRWYRRGHRDLFLAGSYMVDPANRRTSIPEGIRALDIFSRRPAHAGTVPRRGASPSASRYRRSGRLPGQPESSDGHCVHFREEEMRRFAISSREPTRSSSEYAAGRQPER